MSLRRARTYAKLNRRMGQLVAMLVRPAQFRTKSVVLRRLGMLEETLCIEYNSTLCLLNTAHLSKER